MPRFVDATKQALNKTITKGAFWGKIESVLPASSFSNATQRENWTRAALWGAGAIFVYALIVAWGLSAGWIGLDRSYALLAAPCLVPVAWYAYGFLQVRDAQDDTGLLISAAGWTLLTFGLLIQDATWRGAQNAARRGVDVDAQSAPAMICFALALVCIVAGAALSFDAWRNSSDL